MSSAAAFGAGAVANPLPATSMRGGTSKGIFIRRDLLPASVAEWDRIFLGIMGSPDPQYGRQLNGMGGGISSLSKICVVGPPTSEDIRKQGVHAEYTFVQVGIRDSSIDYSGNCGNLSSVVGVYAVDEGICDPEVISTSSHASSSSRISRAKIRLWNTNTSKVIETTFPVSTASPPNASKAVTAAELDLPETTIAGVSGTSSQILLDFVNPAGARTGKLLPTDQPITPLTIDRPSSSTESHLTIPSTLLDATNPTVFVQSSDLDQVIPFHAYTKGQTNPTETELVSRTLEALRRRGAEKMGLDPNAQAQPKIAILSPPPAGNTDNIDIVVHALSMGQLHKAVPMTVGLCLGVAANVKGTIAHRIATEARNSRSHEQIDAGLVRISHPGGLVDVGAEFGDNGSVKSAQVVRTGRRLMKGVVWW